MPFISTIGGGNPCGLDSFDAEFDLVDYAPDSRQVIQVGPLIGGVWRISATMISHGPLPDDPPTTAPFLFHEFWTSFVPVIGGSEGISLIANDFYYPCGTISDPPPPDYTLCEPFFTNNGVFEEVRPAADCLCDYHDYELSGVACDDIFWMQIVAVNPDNDLDTTVSLHYIIHGEIVVPPP